MPGPRGGVVKSALPGACVTLAAIGGLWLPALASLALLASPVAHLALLVFVVQLAVRLWQRRSPSAPLAGLAAVLCAELSLGALLLGVPHWVKARAAPALVALEEWKRVHGRYPEVDTLAATFPDPLRASLYAGGCPLYSPAGASFELTCSGVAFTKCTYVAAAASWRGWD